MTNYNAERGYDHSPQDGVDQAAKARAEQWGLYEDDDRYPPVVVSQADVDSGVIDFKPPVHPDENIFDPTVKYDGFAAEDYPPAGDGGMTAETGDTEPELPDNPWALQNTDQKLPDQDPNSSDRNTEIPEGDLTDESRRKALGSPFTAQEANGATYLDRRD